MMRAKKRKKLKMLFRVGMVLCLLFFLIWGIHSWISPTIEEKLSYQAKNLVTEAVNKTVSEELKRMGITYHQMIQLTRDGTGKVTALQADPVLLNQIKSSITEQTMNRLKELSSNKLSIPLGSLTGWNILSGKGPPVAFRLMPESVVNINLYHEFSQAGINQTLHRVYLQIDMEISAIIPGFSMQTEVSTNMEMGQTVIVGEVPGYFGAVGIGGIAPAG